MLSLFQLLLAVFAIYSALNFEEELRLLIPFSCLILMLIVSRIDKGKVEKKTARKSFLELEINKVLKKEPTSIKGNDFFTIESLLWPKSEFLLIDAVHFIFKDMGFKISTGINYRSVDRIVKIPNTQSAFGLEILMSQKEAEKNHPKISRALAFEKEKKGKEKTLIIASTHIHLPLSERGQMNHISKELADFLFQYNMSFITTHHLYSLWQKTKAGEVDIFGFFQKMYSHLDEIFPLNGNKNSNSLSLTLPLQ